jgi:hypothetical protein
MVRYVFDLAGGDRLVLWPSRFGVVIQVDRAEDVPFMFGGPAILLSAEDARAFADVLVDVVSASPPLPDSAEGAAFQR